MTSTPQSANGVIADAHIETGIYPGISSSDYHTGPGVSKSMLDRLARSPAHLRYGVREETPAMALGSAVHCAVLEPEAWERRYYVAEIPRRNTKAWDSYQREAAGRIGIKPDDAETCRRIADAVDSRPVARELLADGQAEQSVYWEDPETGLQCRARPDFLRKDGVVVDLKTAQDASPGAFARSCASFRYHVQQAFYTDGLLFGGDVNAEAFVFLVVEKTPPYAVAVYELAPSAVDLGRRIYCRDLATYQHCRAADSWPGYSEMIEEIDLPARAYREEGIL